MEEKLTRLRLRLQSGESIPIAIAAEGLGRYFYSAKKTLESKNFAVRIRAVIEESLNAGFEQMLLEVKAGLTIKQAFKKLGLENRYYRGEDTEKRRLAKARIMAARAEYIELHKPKSVSKPSHRAAGTTGFFVTMPIERKREFGAMCQELRTSMTTRMNKLVNADLSAYRAGKMDGNLNGNL